MADTTRGAGLAPAVTRGDCLIIAGHGRLVAHVLERDDLVIGRDPACDLVIDHPTLSRRHARLRLGPPMSIQDLGSTNGVRVSRRTANGGDPVALEPGESFHIGGFSFNVVGRADVELSADLRSGRLRVEDPTPAGVPPFVRDVALNGTNVLILGESGVGKEVLAETVHGLSGRAGPLVRINCAAFADALIDNELFGHDKGAFTGAAASKPGLLESAQGGTVFLDEIGELALATQAKLLRAIESHEILRVGSVRPIKIDVRFVAATNRDLPREVAAKRFRHDLYFRLDGITLVVAPLRERRSRIAPLAMRFLDAAQPNIRLTPAALAALDGYAWPGNVRELKAVVERAVLLARGRDIDVRHLVFSPLVEAEPSHHDELADDDHAIAQLSPELRAQREQLIEALRRATGNQTRAAKALGISRTTLVNRLRLFHIARPRS